MYLSGKQKTLLCLLSFCSTITVVGLLFLGYTLLKDGYFESPCETKSCLDSLCQIRTKMDDTVDPCTDFYEFACGNYAREHEIPDDKVGLNTFTYYGDKAVRKMSNLLSEPVNETDNRPFRMAKDLFKSCNNKTHIESRDGYPLLELLDAFGGWPLLEGKNWDHSQWNFFQTLVDLRLSGVTTKFIIKSAVDINLNNTKKRILYFDSPDTAVHVNFLKNGWNDSYVENYLEYILDIAILLGGDSKQMIDEIQDIIEFEVNLTQIIVPREQRRNPQQLFNMMRLKDMQEKFSYFNWVRFLKESYPNLDIEDSEQIAITDIDFFHQFDKLLENTSKRTLANYLMWKVTAQVIPYLSQKFRDRETGYNSKFFGQYKQQPRWRHCVSIVLTEMPIVVSAMYVRKFFDEEARQQATDMVDIIKQEFGIILKTETWMDDITREAALVKLDSMSAFVGYPDELKSDRSIEDFYVNLRIKEGDFFESILRNNRFLLEKWSGLLREPVIKSDWRLLANVADINAYYDAAENKIRIPAGIFQDHFFAKDRPKFLNYGAIGFVIGHEVIHGFDDLGSRFDQHGNLNNWWQNATKETYNQRTKCFVQQYSRYKDPRTGIALNGKTTLGENIADNGGIKIAYRAYQKWLSQNRKEAKLFGLDYTPEQLFWITNAQTWCSIYRQETLTSIMKVGTVTPGKFRVLGYFQNSEEFANDFNCPIGSSMNPFNKCKVW